MFPPTAGIWNDLFADNLLNMVYGAALLAGIIYAVFLLFFQGIGDAFGDLDFDLDAHADLGELHLIDAKGAAEATGVSMLAVASFVSSFGAFGLIAVTLFDAGTAASLLTALAGGLVLGVAGQAFFLYVLSPTISSEVQQTRLVGRVAEITTPIPTKGVGQIALVAKGSRITYTARAADETQGISRGTPVRIERIVGGVAYVSKVD